MINDLKLGIKAVKYGLNGKGVPFALILCFVLGALCEILMPIGPFGGMWLGMVAMWVIQAIHSITVSTMVQSSPYKKKLQTKIPALMGCGYLLIANTITLLLKWFGYQWLMGWSETDEDVLIIFEQGEFSTGIILSSIIMVFIVIYTGFGLKYYEASIILLLGGVAWLHTYDAASNVPLLQMPTGLAVVISYVVILLGSGILYFIFKGSYKRDYSKATFEMSLKRSK